MLGHWLVRRRIQANRTKSWKAEGTRELGNVVGLSGGNIGKSFRQEGHQEVHPASWLGDYTWGTAWSGGNIGICWQVSHSGRKDRDCSPQRTKQTCGGEQSDGVRPRGGFRGGFWCLSSHFSSELTLETKQYPSFQHLYHHLKSSFQ